MTTQLRAPEKFGTNSLGSFSLPDGFIMARDREGWYSIDEKHEYQIPALLQQGWRLRSDIESEQEQQRSQQRGREERERQMSALSIDEILTAVEKQGARLRLDDGRLLVRSNPGPALMQVLRFRRADLVQALIDRGEQWREV